MIALRGIVQKKPVEEIAQTAMSDNSNTTTRASTSHNTSLVWSWQGVWAFGTIESPTKGGGRGSAASSSSVKKPKPYYYSFVKPQKASETAVPSLNMERPIGKKQEDGTTKKEKKSGGSGTVVKGNEAPDAVVAGQAHQAALSVEGKDTSEPMDSTPIDETTESSETRNTKETPKPQAVTHQENDMKNSSCADPDQILATKPDKAAAASKNQEAMSNSPPAATLSESSTSKTKPMITFATMPDDDPAYTEASVSLSSSSSSSHDCPPDGAWIGHFENAVKRRYPISDRNKIAERFCLFFNATPPKDARVLFALPARTAASEKQKTHETLNSPGMEDPGKLPEGHVHVRGMGTNQFGTFELIGSWNPATGFLECQKMYVANPNKSPRKNRSPKSKRVDVTPSDILSSEARHSRKRHLSWRKRESLEEEELRRTLVRQQKRPRPAGIATPASTPAGTADSLASALKIEIVSSAPVPFSVKRVSPKTPAPVAGAVMPSAPAPRRARTTPVARNTVGTGPSSFVSTITLPTVPDPRLARWRAAHFLYFDNTSDHADISGGTPPPGASSSGSSVNFVVYEGEMYLGQREGRGACLYNNNTLYEGEWKRNQEHGKGTLMTADRKRIIYEGEWERGRMQGRGSYYYSDLYSSEERSKCRYEGDFKEGKRHGTGKYYLPDGSSYDGDWRDDAMSGTGTFRWPDGSVYTGSWKDSKRNGDGVLHASDGFVYDGSWVANTMEGRGEATYPSGQRYQGLWANGRREGRGTIHFVNGAVYEGRFRDDCIEGQGTMKMTANAMVPRPRRELGVAPNGDIKVEGADHMEVDTPEHKDDWMIPVSFQSDMGHIHRKAGFTIGGE